MLSTLRSHVKVIRLPEPSQWYRSLHTAIPSLSDIGSDAPLFDKILVANRGEIACRVFRTAKRMGIKTVAVYSDADADSLHVAMADEAVNIGPAPSNESYLLGNVVLAAAKKTGAQAIHPGYGFLSENPAFAQECEDAGIEFIGPGPEAMKVMGLKTPSMKVAQEAGVSTAPRYDGNVESVEHALELAPSIGFPIIMKASAGGGGKGMRVCWDMDELAEGFTLARDEAIASFNDDKMLMQHFVCPNNGRHVEIQVLGDKHGNYLALPERECSIQRRHQKVIEEAPSPIVTPEMRAEMGAQAVALCKAVNYESAGTVEFLVDPDTLQWYFLEMNTRLQVEHPITEHITGIDLVEQMIRVAAGEELSIAQDDIEINGWAVESRVYAEDSVNYLPSIGTLATYIEPKASNPDAEWPDVRVDTGVVEGSEISVYYDPMICKLITYGEDRQTALDLMAKALDSYVIKGVEHNIPLLRDVIRQPRFVSGDIDTEFLKDVYPNKFEGYLLDSNEKDQLVSAAVLLHLRQQIDNANFAGLSQTAHIATEVVATVGEEMIAVSAAFDPTDADSDVTITFSDGRSLTLGATWSPGQALFEGITGDDVPQDVIVQFLGRSGTTMALRFCGTVFDVAVRSKRDQELFAFMPPPIDDFDANAIATPMPGVCVSVNVAVGDAVSAGQTVAVIEAMKMQNNMHAPRAGIIKSVTAVAGQTLDADEVIIELEAEAEAEEAD